MAENVVGVVLGIAVAAGMIVGAVQCTGPYGDQPAYSMHSLDEYLSWRMSVCADIEPLKECREDAMEICEDNEDDTPLLCTELVDKIMAPHEQAERELLSG